MTAQKRQEKLQDVPVSISVLSGSELDKSHNGLIDALTLVPGVSMSGGGVVAGNNLFGVRGVSAVAPQFTGGSAVGYYLDQVPYGFVRTAQVPDANPFDLSQVEVLRGPQGTLYGASALNGVVRINTQDADLNEFDLKARASLSSVDRGGESYGGDLAVNAPIVPGTLAVRAVVGYKDDSGWIDSRFAQDTNDVLTRTGRVKVNAKPTEKLSLGLSTWVSRADYGAPNAGNANDVFLGLLDQSSFANYDVIGLTINYEFPSFSFTSSTGHIDYENRAKIDFSHLGFVNDVLHTIMDAEVLAQEFALASTSEGAWQWTLGAFYRDAEDRLQQLLSVNPGPIDVTDQSESFAVFGELTRGFADGRVKLTGGLRYFEDEVHMTENALSCGATCPGAQLIRTVDKFDAVSPRVVLTWQPRDRLTVYGSYSEGFRSGFQNLPSVYRTAPGFPAVEEDTLRNHELGVKGSFLDGRVSYELAGYYMKWEDVQLQTGVLFNGIPLSASLNSKSASGPGADFAASFRPAAGLDFGISVSWNDLTLDESILRPNGTVVLAKGDRLNLSGRSTATATFGYIFPIGGGGLEAGISAAGSYTSKVPIGGVNGVLTGDDIVNTRANLWIGSPDRWRASLFADNVDNDHKVIKKDPFLSRDFYQRPRMIGLQLEYQL